MQGAHHGEHPRLVVIEGASVTVGRTPDSGLRLTETTVSRRHATLRRADGRLAVEDHDSRFGTFVNGVRIRMVSLQPGDRIQFGALVSYRVDSQGLVLDDSAHGMSLAVTDLWLVRGGRCLVERIRFEIEPDTFVGILGPSGAGKSTLLNCLASYLPPARGRVTYDGSHDLQKHLEAYRGALGHVPQEDAVCGALSTEENLTFAARLRLGAEASAAEIAEEVTRALDQVGLTAHAEKLVRVLSGGQRKRLSVAIALLKRPRLLLLDEPTSGLDPASEAHLMEQLQQVAVRGTTVVCTTHLMDNLRLFDQVIVLGVSNGTGRVAYVGPPSGLLLHFGCRGFADLYEQMEQGKFTPLGEETDAPAPVVSHAAPSSVASRPAGVSLVRSHTDLESSAAAVGLKLRQLVVDSADEGFWRQLVLLTERSLVQYGRNVGLLLAAAAQPLALGGLTCLTQASALHGAAMLFYLVVIAIWLGLNNSVRDLVRERKLYIRERLAGLRPGAFLASKWLVHTLVGAAQMLLLLGVFNLGVAYLAQPPLADELRDLSTSWTFCVLMVTYSGALAIGLLVSASVRTEEAAVAFLPLLVMPQLLISAVGTGGVEEIVYSSHEPLPFRPLGIKVQSEASLSGVDSLIDFLSLGCLSRPALLLVKEPTIARDHASFLRLADLAHLGVLVLGVWILTLWVFHRAEEQWTRLIGVG